MKLRLVFLFMLISSPVLASPAADARHLLTYLELSKDRINQAGRRGDDVALDLIRRESIRRDDAWPTGHQYDRFQVCHQALVDQINFLQAYAADDNYRRDHVNRALRSDRDACRRALP